ncbi:hypothetical protein A4H97_03495 [Niastella yeongjuensis]|uniref:DUF4271 domain-containing protein n=2 Tax=Niastella yeongjuensis TaxID=354355 RepID=A0A1V9EXR0_9BACT|nr:hypothetical protein A4H97_03495 [Niastella yeongjuensis]SEN12379.1 protein of unknown function [Niastella yeongjuensis]
MIVSLAQGGKDTIPSREQRDTPGIKRDTVTRKKDTAARKRDTAAKVLADSAHTAARRDTVDSVKAIRPPVTVATRPDSGIPVASVVKGGIPEPQPTLEGFQNALRDHPYYNFYGKGVLITEQLKKESRDESMFYFLCLLLFFYGFIRIAFLKYLDNLNTLFFRVTMRHQQIRDQVLQSPLPSLFLNILFVISTGLFLSFVADYYNIVPGMNHWLLLFYCCVLLATIYIGKFILLKMIGWMFNIRSATDTYIFIVFLVNKMLGIYLLPALLFMAFAKGQFLTILMTLTYFFIVILFIYRFIIAYRPVRNEIKLSRFHFFVYLCAFEIAPLLLIYKVLLIFVERSY